MPKIKELLKVRYIIEVLIKAGASCYSYVMQKLSHKRKHDEIKLDGESISKALLLARDEYRRAAAQFFSGVGMTSIFPYS